jgi:P27 family predicted phage terminase small subunit
MQPPEWLGDDAKALWRETVDLDRQASHLLCPLDHAILSVYVTAVIDLRELQAFIDQHGMTYTNEDGVLCARPEAELKFEFSNTLLEAAKALGFTPASRARIQQPEREDWQS